MAGLAAGDAAVETRRQGPTLLAAVPGRAAGETPATVAAPPSEEDLNALYARLARPLRAYLRRLVATPEAADDLLQETFYRYLRADRPPLDERQTTTYVYRIATRLVQDGWRRASRERRSRESEPPPAEGVPARDHAPGVDLDRAFRDLQPRQRSLLWLACVEEASHREIAEVLGVREASVKVLLFRARRRLARALARRGLTEEDLR